MRNKRGGIGAKLILVLILMIASAVGGAYGYSVIDGKMAVSDANKIIDRVNVAEYDTPEASTIQGYIDQAAKDLETAKSRKEVYEIIDQFKEDVDKVQTRSEKELEAARKELEEARKNSAVEQPAAADSTGTNSNSFEAGDDGSGDKSEGGILNNIFGSKDSEEGSSEQNTYENEADSIY